MNTDLITKVVILLLSILNRYTVALGQGGRGNWPDGLYALLATETGCPGYADKTQAWNIHIEGSETYPIDHSENFWLHGPVNLDAIRLLTCSCTRPRGSGQPWPAGQYCILKSHNAPCPPGFMSSPIDIPASYQVAMYQRHKARLRDEDIILPTFCCRTDGVISKEIELPTQEPFALFMLGEKCQQIKGMTSNLQWIRLYEDNTTSNASDKQAKTYYWCIYHPNQRDNSGIYCGEKEWLHNKGYCYYFYNGEEVYYKEGREICHARNSELLSITSLQEWNFISDAMLTLYPHIEDYYTGLTDTNTEGTFEWADGRPFDDSFGRFAYNGPLDLFRVADCVEMWNFGIEGHVGGGVWYADVACTDYKNYICKKLDVSDDTNVALGRHASQSSTEDKATASAATDGLKDTCSLTTLEEAPWWSVDLLQDYIVESVEIFSVTKGDNGISIYLEGSPSSIGSHSAFLCARDVTLDWLVVLVQCVQPVRGRYITVVRQTARVEKLQLCEVRVYGKATGCNRAIGLSTGEIPDLDMFASSYSGLYMTPGIRLGSAIPWCVAADDPSPYVVVDLGHIYILQHLQVKSKDSDSTTTFTLEYSSEVGEWRKYHKIHRGFNVLDTKREHIMLWRHLKARYVKLDIIRTAAEVTCLQLELYGCSGDEEKDVCSWRYGFNLYDLPQKLAPARSLLLSGLKFKCDGFLAELGMMSTAVDPFYLTVWRWLSESHTAQMVDKRLMMPTTTGLIRMIIQPPMLVQTGDFLGIHILPNSSFWPMSYMAGSYHFSSMYPLHMEQAYMDTDPELDLIPDLHADITATGWRIENIYLNAFVNITTTTMTADRACDFVIREEGDITSPDYPRYYGAEKTCTWKILAPPGKYIQLHFADFELMIADEDSRCEDTLSVYAIEGNSSRLLRAASGSFFPLIMDRAPELMIKLTSCLRTSVVEARGFHALLAFVDCPGCYVGGQYSEMHCDSCCGYIASPNYPYPYDNFLTVSWILHVPDNHYVRLDIIEHNVESPLPDCSRDHILVYDLDYNGARKNVIGRYCNAAAPLGPLYSNWNFMEVVLITDGAYTKPGFYAFFSCLQYSVPDHVMNDINTRNPLCPDTSWVSYRGACYKQNTVQQSLTFSEAEAECVKEDAHLTSILSDNEMLFIHYLLTVHSFTSSSRTYIGLQKVDARHNLQWIDGQPLIYTSWYIDGANSQPDGGVLEGCCIIDLSGLHTTQHWHDVPCANRDTNQYLCKKIIIDNDEFMHNDGGGGHAVKRAAESPVMSSGLGKRSAEVPRLSTLFKCGNGEYISSLFVCDGVAHCVDESDERNCHNADSMCDSGFWSCDNTRCLPMSRVCDFRADCDDGTDEMCVLPDCGADEFRCSNGQCIPVKYRCNILVDCEDGTDEQNCDTCQLRETYQCYDGQCIPLSARCDGVPDCLGTTHEDELDCLQWRFSVCDDTTGYITCNLNYYKEKGYIEFHLYDETRRVFAPHEEVESQAFFITAHYMAAIPDDRIVAFINDIAYECEQSVTVQFLLDSPRGSLDRLLEENGDDKKVFWSSFSNVLTINLKTEDKFNYTETITVRDRSFLPLEVLVLSLPPSVALSVTISSVQCTADFVSNELVTTVPCKNDQDMSVARRCLLEWDKYGMPLGCRDMTHLQDCNNVTDHRRECLDDPAGAGYKGVRNTTEDGHSCQRWDVSYPNDFFFKSPSFFGEERMFDIHNFCRNPISDPNGPFCYYKDSLGYGHCGLPICGELRGSPFVCPEDYTQCHGGYCIPTRYVCDGQWHCPDGEDEHNCESRVCIGQYRCTDTNVCIPLKQICDEEVQCTHGDDEMYCDTQCPSHNCTCVARSVECVKKGFFSIPQLTQNLAHVSFEGNYLAKINPGELDQPFLISLVLSHNHLQQLEPGLFEKCENLNFLDVSFNKIQVLQAETFSGLHNLKHLSILGNFDIFHIEPGAFHGMTSVHSLDLRSMSIESLADDVFAGLATLGDLNLSDNAIGQLGSHAFRGLYQLKSLDLTGNPLNTLTYDTFVPLRELSRLRSSEFRTCCLAPQVDRHNCHPSQDAISSCEDLMQRTILRVFLWIMGLMACFGNLIVIVWRLVGTNRNVSDIIITNLAVSDMLMGIYMICIASVDIHYRGIYIEHDADWRESVFCRFLGFLATLSTEGSVLFLCCVTLDRFVNIVFPFSGVKFTTTSVKLWLGGAWLLAFTLSAIPLIPIDYFGSSFYGRSGVCMALPLTNERPLGWEYSTAMYLGFNLVGFLVIIISYIIMYISVQRTTRVTGGMEKRKQIALARRILLVVLTDFACWIPIIAMGLAAANGTEISGEVYAWVVVFILPVNSAINPILYTLSTINLLQLLLPKQESSTDSTASNPERKKPVKGSGIFIAASAMVLSDHTQSLRHYVKLREGRLDEYMKVLMVVGKAMEKMHESGLAHGALSSDMVQVRETEGRMEVYLGDFDVRNSTEAMADDIFAFGQIVREILQSMGGYKGVRESMFTVESTRI